MVHLAGRTVAVTGASRGIGAAIAEELVRSGARVVLGARDEDELRARSAELAEHGGEVAYRVTDVTRPEELVALVELAKDRFGRLDVLVSNAGVAFNAPLESGDLADWNTMIDVNLRGVLHGIAAALPVFRDQRSGHFVTIGSTSGMKWVPGQGVYAASKAAVRAVTDVLRQECAPLGIRCTHVQPGFVATEFVTNTRDEAHRAELLERRDAIAMPPEAIARAVAYVIAQPAEVNIGELVVRPTVQP